MQSSPLNAYLSTLPAMQAGRVRKTLAALTYCDSVVMTRAEKVEKRVLDGLTPSTELDTPTIPEEEMRALTWTAYTREGRGGMTNAEFNSHIKAREEAKRAKTIHLLGDYIITATEYAYAIYLRATK